MLSEVEFLWSICENPPYESASVGTMRIQIYGIDQRLFSSDVGLNWFEHSSCFLFLYLRTYRPWTRHIAKITSINSLSWVDILRINTSLILRWSAKQGVAYLRFYQTYKTVCNIVRISFFHKHLYSSQKCSTQIDWSIYVGYAHAKIQP